MRRRRHRECTGRVDDRAGADESLGLDGRQDVDRDRAADRGAPGREPAGQCDVLQPERRNRVDGQVAGGGDDCPVVDVRLRAEGQHLHADRGGDARGVLAPCAGDAPDDEVAFLALGRDRLDGHAVAADEGVRADEGGVRDVFDVEADAGADARVGLQVDGGAEREGIRGRKVGRAHAERAGRGHVQAGAIEAVFVVRHPVDAHGRRDAHAAAVAVARLATRVAARRAGGVRRLRQRPPSGRSCSGCS